MNDLKSRNSVRWWTGGVLAAVAATATATALAFGGGGMGHGMGGDGSMGGRGGHMGERGRHGGGHMMERVLDSADATKEQRTKIRQIMVAAEEDQRAARAGQQDDRGAMMNLLAQPKIDVAAIEKLRAQRVATHDASSKRMTQAMVEAANVLSPEQRKKVADQMAQMQHRRAMMQEKGQGPGAGPDRQPGRANDAATK